jgi:pimeloyl-ACP methyl ester carboxylesterase
MEELERLIPEGQRKLAIIPGTGHHLWQDRPKESNQAILEFLKGK